MLLIKRTPNARSMTLAVELSALALVQDGDAGSRSFNETQEPKGNLAARARQIGCMAADNALRHLEI